MKVFKEEQRFTQTWVIALIVISTIVPLISVFKEYNDGKTSVTSLVSTLLMMMFFGSIIFFFKLRTRVDEYGIHYQFFPFQFRFKIITWNEIKSAKIRKYDAISEYGGWGLKSGVLWSSKRGKAINVAGDIGIQLLLKNDKKLLIGTQKEYEATQVLKTYQDKINDKA